MEDVKEGTIKALFSLATKCEELIKLMEAEDIRFEPVWFKAIEVLECILDNEVRFLSRFGAGQKTGKDVA